MNLLKRVIRGLRKCLNKYYVYIWFNITRYVVIVLFFFENEYHVFQIMNKQFSRNNLLPVYI